jgi:hypothetical protein
MSACGDDFLEQPPRSALTVGTFPTTADDAVLATNAAYNSLRIWQINTGGFPLLDIMSDEATKGSNPGDGIEIGLYDKFEHRPTEGSLERWYKTLYLAVRRTNLVINDVPNIAMNPDLQARLVAEGRFLRAYFYSLLVRGFGDVPKITDIDPALDLGRSPVSEILNEIIYPDLEYAISVLPEKSEYAAEDLGRATRGAARALLARIKLFYGDYAATEQLTRDIINSGEYELVPDYSQIFVSTNEHNEESVFEVSAVPLSFENGGNQYGNTQGVRGTPDKGWGFCRPAWPLIQEWRANNDPREDPSILYLKETIDGITISGEGATPDTTKNSNGQIIEVECYNQKVWFPGTNSITSFGHNRRIIRYADVLLMHAEALNENGKSAEALAFINQVRQRARGANPDVLPDVSTTDKAQLRDAIIAERKYEFALEGLRYWDLVRTNKAEAILGPLGFVKGKHELFPIPQSEIDISQGRITQNPGW